MYLHRVLCKRTFKYLYYKDLPKPFLNNKDFKVDMVRYSVLEVKPSFVVSNTAFESRFIPKDMLT